MSGSGQSARPAMPKKNCLSFSFQRKDDGMMKKKQREEKCSCVKPEPAFSENGLLEWCHNCGKLICDHHLRKFGSTWLGE